MDAVAPISGEDRQPILPAFYGDARCEVLPVSLAQGRYKRIAVLTADFAILVAMTLIRAACFMMVSPKLIGTMRFSYLRP
jgi:hypothetical protein